MKKGGKNADFFRRRVEREAPKRSVFKSQEWLQMERIIAQGNARFFSNFSMKILDRMRPGGGINGKVIFLGQGMRPLFETMKKLNDALHIVPRSRIRYFIYSSEHRGKPHYKRGEAVEALIKTGIVDKKTNEFVVIDFDTMGHVDGFIAELKMAARKIPFSQHKEIKVLNLDDVENPYEIGISEGIPRPVRTERSEKRGMVRIEPSKTQPKHDASLAYLIQQEAIQDEVERIAREHKK